MVTGAGTGCTLASLKKTVRAKSHNCFTSISAKGVPHVNLDNHCSSVSNDADDELDVIVVASDITGVVDVTEAVEGNGGGGGGGLVVEAEVLVMI